MVLRGYHSKKMERYIIENYSLRKGEFIIEDFNGALAPQGVMLTGRIYLTNERFIVCGKMKGKAHPREKVLTSGVAGKAINKWGNKMYHFEHIQMREDISGRRCFGYRYRYSKL